MFFKYKARKKYCVLFLVKIGTIFLTPKQKHIHLAEELLKVSSEVFSVYQCFVIIHLKVVIVPFESHSLGWTCKKATTKIST